MTRSLASVICAIFGAYLALVSPSLAAPGGKNPTRLSVTLFGQPCVLEGPMETEILKSIHAISPEQICSPFSVERTADETRRAIEKLKGTTGLPASLDRYREKLTRRLKAEQAFLESFVEARKAKSSHALAEATREYVLPNKRKELENLFKGYLAAPADSAKRKELLPQIYDFYNEAIDANPEDEFHRAIRTMKVQYICSFEESDESESE